MKVLDFKIDGVQFVMTLYESGDVGFAIHDLLMVVAKKDDVSLIKREGAEGYSYFMFITDTRYNLGPQNLELVSEFLDIEIKTE